MKKKFRITTITIVLALLMSTGIFSANFRDVPANEWYAEYVNKAADAGIIKGYDDNTFKPNGKIAFTEISSLLGNLVNVTEAEMQAANSTYGKELDEQLKIVKSQGNPGIDWARPVILKCLQAGVYDISTLKSAVASMMLLDTQVNKRPNVSRSNTAVFIADALKLNVDAASLTYKDTNKIPANAQTKIQALIDIGVLSKNGDGNGYFKPSDSVDRASVAKMITVAMDYISKNPSANSNISGSNSQIIPTPNVTKTMKGTVKDINSQLQNAVILISSGNSSQALYLNYSTSITVDGSPALFDKIQEGMLAEVSYNDSDKVVTKAAFKSQETKLSGKISKVLSSSKFEIEYAEGSILNNKMEVDFKNADIILDGKKARIGDLNEGFEVELTLLGDVVKKVEAKKGNAYSDGTFYSFGYNRGDYYLELVPNGKTRRESIKLDNYNVYIDGKSVRTSELDRSGEKYIRRGTTIKLKIGSDNRVTDIETVFVLVDNGKMTGYLFDNPRYNDDNYILVSPKISSNSYYNDSSEVKVDRYTKIRIDGYEKNLTDLRRDYFLEITMRNGIAEYIDVSTKGDILSGAAGVAEGNLYSMSSPTSDMSIYIDKYYITELSNLRIFKQDRNIEFLVNGKTSTKFEFYKYYELWKEASNKVQFDWYSKGSNYYITKINIK